MINKTVLVLTQEQVEYILSCYYMKHYGTTDVKVKKNMFGKTIVEINEDDV